MAGLGIIFNVKFRLFLIIIVTVIALVLQSFIILDSQDTLTSLEDEGNFYLDFDAEILANLAEMDNLGQQMVRAQLEYFVERMLFKDYSEPQAASQSHTAFSESIISVKESLLQRATYNYKINVTSDNILGLELVDQATLDELEGIIGITDVFDAYERIEFLEGQIFDDFIDLVNNTDTLRDNYLENAELFNASSVELVNETLDSIHSSLDATTTRLNITGLDTIKAEIDVSTNTDLLDKLQINEIDPVNDSIGLTYIINTVTEFNHIQELIDKIMIHLSELQNFMVFRENTRETTFGPAISEFMKHYNETLEEIDEEMGELNGSILVTDQTNLNNLNFLVETEYKPKILNMTSSLQQMYNSLHEMGVFVSSNLDDMAYFITDRIDQAELAIILENIRFAGIFNEVRDDVRANFNQVLQLTSVVLVIGMFLLILLITIQMATSFRKIGKEYQILSQGNLAVLGKSKRYASNEFGQMHKGFDTMVNNLRDILEVLQSASERMAGISEELAAGSEEASASVNEVSETVREFSAGSSEQNLLLNRVSGKLNEHQQEVEEAAKRIGETSSFVLKVAKRTNILGLNASIEAAKAGKFGRGFNVVAEEVRNLSEDTKGSANQIANLIEEIEYNMKNTVDEILREVNITKEVAENTAAGSEEANAATSEQVIMLKEISQTSNELSLLAQELREVIHRFTLE
ncbi:MAG: methyl-accepting chemotaxis protein [Candidatus Kariarchaeaceae archaeon]|jgi:methyl-accepting chemotaxis protein